MLKNIEIKYYEKLSKYSTIKLGGEARLMCFPRDIKQLKRCLNFAQRQKMKIFVLGNGSNTLFDDDGFDGMVINLKKFDKIKFYSTGVYAGAGVKLFMLNQKLAEHGYSGLEWSYGIPGTLGGLVKINGGSFGKEIFDYVEYVVIFHNGKIVHLKKSDIDFSYRRTNIDGIILFVKLALERDSSEGVRKQMLTYYDMKKASQPYDALSLGSVFKQVHLQNEVLFPSKMIDTMGLKGVKIGGVEVSKKHAGFIINTGDATSNDVRSLILFLKEKIKSQYGCDLETEIVILER